MPELIDKLTPSTEIYTAVCRLGKGYKSDWLNGYIDGLETALEVIQKAPTVEAVPVVRCAECKKCSHDTMFGTRWCHGHEVKPDDFCSRGERSEGE